MSEATQTEIVDEVEILHSPDNALRISMGAQIVAWIILVLYGFQFVYNLINAFQSGFTLQANMDTVLTFLQMLTPLFIGLFFFTSLQAAAQVIYIALDIFSAMVDLEDEA
jgi:hypothetical protein